MKIYFLLTVLEMHLLFWKVDWTICKIPEIKVGISNLKVVFFVFGNHIFKNHFSQSYTYL